MSGCASWRGPGWIGGLWPAPPAAAVQEDDPLGFLAQAMAADGAKREALWRESTAGERTPSAVLQTALMQSLPGHAGYDPPAAERELERLLAQEPPLPAPAVAVARVRLSGLKDARSCGQEVDALRRRLTRVVDIERSLERNHGTR